MADDGTIDIALCDKMIYVKVTGLGTMNNCMSLLELCVSLLDAGYKEVAFDLAKCDGMDSTFLGVIAGIATHGPDRKGPKVTVVNCGKECLSSLEIVGLTKFVNLKSEPVQTPDVEMFRLEEEDVPDMDRVGFIREAHEQLLLIDKHNRDLFGPLLRMLGDELSQKGGK
ncbi:MAG: STAS domain-containing protein [Planctomycetes bacterium]|nr:STAS domain-containing protein [Planctomycetota bacterium]